MRGIRLPIKPFMAQYLIPLSKFVSVFEIQGLLAQVLVWGR